LTSVILKSRSIPKPGQESLIFKMAACRSQNRSNRENQIKYLGVLPKGILTPSFIEIAPVVTKRALLTDDADGRHVIAIAHQR
jgi:hypothetical protein